MLKILCFVCLIFSTKFEDETVYRFLRQVDGIKNRTDVNVCSVTLPVDMSQSIKAPRKPIASLTEPVNLTVVFVGAYSQTVNILPYAYRMILTNMTKFPPINFNFVGLIGCSGISSVNEIERQFYTQSMDALIGPSCDQDTDAVSQLAGLLNVPVFTYGSSAIQLLGKTDLYRTLVSLTSSSATSITLSTLAFLSNLNFTRVSVIYAEDDPNVMTRVKFLIEILNSVQMDQLKINLSQNFTSDAITRSGKLNDIKGHSRLIICLMGLDISYCSSVMQVLHDLGYVSPDYLVLLPWILHTSASETYPWITKKNDIDKDTWLLYQNHIVIDNDMFDSPISDTFLASLPTTQWLTGDITSTTTHLISRIYDCMKAYMESIALAYNVSDPNAVYNGTALKQQLLNFYFDGATGPVEFDIRAARSPYYIYYMITDNPVGNQDIEGGFNKPRLNNICTNFTDDQVNYIKCFNLTISISNQTLWDQLKRRGLDPVCGYDNTKCADDISLFLFIGIPSIIMTTLIILMLIYFWCYSKNKNISWHIPYEDIVFNEDSEQSTNFTASRHSYMSDGSQTHFSEPHSKVHIQQCKFQQYECQYKSFKQLKNITFDKTELKLLSNVSKISNVNLNVFIGVAFNHNANYFITLWSLCSRGSLYEYLHNSNMRMDLNFKAAFIFDILNGLQYIHDGSLAFHGNLSCYCCHITSNWILQISDFGIIEIEDTFLLTNQIAHEVQDQTEQDKPPETTKDKKKKIQNIEKDVSIKIDKNNNMAFNESDEALYKAPELLKKPIFPHLRLDNQDISDIPNLKTNMQLADAYSAGIIFFEILYRTKVFEGDRDDLKGLVDVLSGKYYKQTKTPQIPYIEGNGKENHPAVVSILQQCFDKDPSMRPSIKKIKKIFHSVLKMKGNLVDSVIAMMDKYANDLEKTVKERTKMLEDVQLRVDKLLSHMLPKEIAESLKMGQTVEPRVFRSATVLFCDICSFNLICTESNPIQIVAFLNTLFTAYDQILAKFDAYKVETQEDCMLVVSGVPKENGTNNVSIIASIALAMRNFLFSYTLLHMPKHTLEGRWGINSGSVAAGIIGLKSPRYCLFGDTVNMSSRMESTSKAGKIQMTIESRNLLKSRKDSFITKKRGTVSVKGKGDWSTYWLISSTSNDKPSTEDDHNDESDKAMSDDEI